MIIGGVFVGLANGFFGGGGGMLCVPLLEKGLKRSTKVAHATALIIILPISIFSAVCYIINGYLDFYPLFFTGLGVIAGGIGGAVTLKILPAKIVGVVFALLMISVGVKLSFF